MHWLHKKNIFVITVRRLEKNRRAFCSFVFVGVVTGDVDTVDGDDNVVVVVYCFWCWFWSLFFRFFIVQGEGREGSVSDRLSKNFQFKQRWFEFKISKNYFINNKGSFCGYIIMRPYLYKPWKWNDHPSYNQYGISKKSWLMIYSNLKYKVGQDFLDILYKTFSRTNHIFQKLFIYYVFNN